MAEKKPGELGCAGAVTLVMVLLFAGTLIGAFCYRVGEVQGMNAARQQAVEAGVGRYEADPATGRVEFKFGAK